MSDLITILEEPTGATYEALLRYALSRNSLFSLVWRDQLSFDTSARAVATTLETDLVVSSRTDAWPGTQLSDTLATVNLYRFSSRSLAVLSCVSSVYAWKSPAMPEDLAFYTSDQTPWFGSIAHEADSFIYGGTLDVQQLLTAVPGLSLEFATWCGLTHKRIERTPRALS